MDIRKLVVSIAAVAAVSPSIAAASPENTALNACASAFAVKIASPGAAPPSYKLQYRGGQSETATAEYYAREYTFYLRANDGKTGQTLARATCSVDTHGAVISLTTEGVSAAALAKAL
ncbi:MAG TPA: hypothetical protein VGH12_05725 [Steroidobacteraceae bacterium]|jgi:hypothetical protein